MQTQIDDRLAMALLGGSVRDGDTVRVDLAEDGESLTVASVAAPTDSPFDDEDLDAVDL